MDTNIDCNLTIEEPSTEHLELSYEIEQEKALRVDMAANQQETSRPTDVNNEATPSHIQHEDDVINIQLLYNPQVSTESELWSGKNHSISFHGSIEHFISDSKNIKVTLNFLAKYIQNKQVNGGKVNNLDDFNGMGDAIWNFISAVYVARWDALFTDQKSNTLSAKIFSKLTSQTPSTNNNNKKEIPKSIPISINRTLPLPPLLAKSKKESMSSPNISNPRSPQSRTMLKISMSKLENHMPRPPKLQSIPLKF